jgi:hypothetical protein
MSENEENNKPIEVVFAPGCFDQFEGTQEELDELIQEIKEMASSGKLFENSTPVLLEDIEDLIDETDPLEIEEIVNQMTSPRTLQ